MQILNEYFPGRTPEAQPARNLTESRIVEAAAQLFARQGYRNTSTREIAQHAQLNEATLFRYFSTKTQMFEAALEARLSGVKLSRELQQALEGDDRPEVVLPEVVRFLVDTVLHQPELLPLLCVTSIELPQFQALCRRHLGVIFDQVRAYLDHCAQLGHIAPVDSALATLSMAGGVLSQMALWRLFTGQELTRWQSVGISDVHCCLWLKALGKEPPGLTV